MMNDELIKRLNRIRAVIHRVNYFFGRLEPYLERLFLRLFTPAVSRAPRTMV